MHRNVLSVQHKMHCMRARMYNPPDTHLVLQLPHCVLQAGRPRQQGLHLLDAARPHQTRAQHIAAARLLLRAAARMLR